MSDTGGADWSLAEEDANTVNGWLEAGSAVLIDVRETHEYEYEHIPGALLAPLSFLDPTVFPRLGAARLVIMCQVGRRSAAAAKQLAQAGFENLVNLKGGLDAWREAGLDTQGARFEEEDYSI